MISQPAPGGDGENRSTAKPRTGSCACPAEVVVNAATVNHAQHQELLPVVMFVLELGMYPCSVDVDWSAIDIERWIDDVLVVCREPDRVDDVQAIESFVGCFGSLREKTVANEAVNASHL